VCGWTVRQRKGCQSVLLWEEDGHIWNCPDEVYFVTCGDAFVDGPCSEQVCRWQVSRAEVTVL
jgi:hypothetical protein